MTTSATRRRIAPELAYRADIDGLRAVAVLSVIGFHASPKAITGGFIGVDIFFVISGYLISSLILSGLKNGSFNFLDFYARRARRIFPALIIVLIFVWGLGWFAFDPPNFIALSKHIVAGAAFAANIVTYFEVGYFDVPANTKPLLHLWSLGVEEQFYLIFPVLVVLVWRHRSANLILSVIAVASFALNVVTVRYSPSFAFYLPLTRFWEFLAGALLAYDSVKFGGTARFEANVLRDNAASAIGMLMICGGIFIVPAAGDYPGWWALLPVVGTVLIIWAGQHTWINRKILADQKLVFIGLISYPLYLWHWPLIVMGQAIVSDYSPANPYARTTTIVAVAISFVLSWVTFEFVERPIRTRRFSIGLRWIAGASAVCLATVALIAVVTLANHGFPERYPKEIQALLTPVTWDGFPVRYPEENQALLPSLTSGADHSHPDEKKNAIGPLLIAYGDSNAQHLLSGLNLLQNERTFRVNLIQWHDCPPVDDVKSTEVENCRRQQMATEEEFTRLKPEIVVIGAFWFKYKHIERLSKTLQFFRRIGVHRIIVMGAVPLWPNRPQSLLYTAMRLDPSHRIPDRLSVFHPDSIKNDIAVKTIAANLGATFISTHDIFCNEQGCLVRSGDTARDIIQPDSLHFSVAGSWYLISRTAHEIFDGILTFKDSQ
ncbi:MAG: acyltransferase family protein [Pseudolabrys sp.]